MDIHSMIDKTNEKIAEVQQVLQEDEEDEESESEDDEDKSKSN